MASIPVAIEVSEAGLSAARAEVAAFLAFVRDREGHRAAIAYVVLRRLAGAMEEAEGQRAKVSAAARPLPRRLSVREERKLAA